MPSFTIELPEIFGADSEASEALKDTRALSLIKTIQIGIDVMAIMVHNIGSIMKSLRDERH